MIHAFHITEIIGPYFCVLIVILFLSHKYNSVVPLPLLPATWYLYMHEITMVTRCAAYNWCGYFCFLTVTKNKRKVQDRGSGTVRDIALKRKHVLFCAVPLQRNRRQIEEPCVAKATNFMLAEENVNTYEVYFWMIQEEVVRMFHLPSVYTVFAHHPQTSTQKLSLLASITEMWHIWKFAIPECLPRWSRLFSVITLALLSLSLIV